VELRCTYDPDTRGGYAPDGRQVKATLHWVSAAHALPGEVRLYDRLFTSPDPAAYQDEDFKSSLNPQSLEVLKPCYLEPSVAGAPPESFYQFERQGYFSVDKDSASGALVFNRSVTLKDPWAKLQQKL
jgi:glutaminyl-tRNA synthetase